MLREAMTAIFSATLGFLRWSARYDTQSRHTNRPPHASGMFLLADQASAAIFPQNFVGDLLSLTAGRKAILFGMDDDAEVFLAGYSLGRQWIPSWRS